MRTPEGVPSAAGYFSDFHPGIKLSDGTTSNAITLKPMDFRLKLGLPVRLPVKPTGQSGVDFPGLLHQVGENRWDAIPDNFRG